jgi:transcriptional regulator with XRE-family HTH domain
MSMISGAQIRAARALLGISAAELAQRAKISHRTLQRFEASDGIPDGRTSVLAKIGQALEAAGIAFTGDALTAPGIQLTKKPPEKPSRCRRRPRIIIG